VVSGPGEGGAAEEAVKEAGVERLEDFVEIVMVAGGGGETLAAAGLADVLGLAGDGFGGDVAAVAVGVGGGDGLLVELGEEDVSDGVVNGVGGGFEQVGETDVEAAFAEADGGVEGGEAAEADVERRNGSAGTEVAVLIFKDGYEGRRCRGFCSASSWGSGRTEWRCGRRRDFVEEGGWGRGRSR
jgi:hypothetical protein